MSFSKQECEILSGHIDELYGIKFYLSPHPHGKGWTIRLSKLEQLSKFFNIIMPYCLEVPCLKYKWDLPARLEQKRQELIITYGGKYRVNISSVENIPEYYSKEDEDTICKMQIEGKTYKEIAAAIGRTYTAISYKIHHLRQQGKL